MYYKILNILVCSDDKQLGQAICAAKPLARFEHRARVMPGRIDPDDMRFSEACIDADILILDVPLAEVPGDLRYLCATKHPVFIYCGTGALLFFGAAAGNQSDEEPASDPALPGYGHGQRA